MKDFSLALLNKIEIIIEQWVEAVRQDEKIETAKELTYKGIRDSLPILLQAIATILSESEDSDIKTLVEKSLEHGKLRAKQGYDAEEIAREYRLIRCVIFSVLEEDLEQGTTVEVIRAMRLIDTAIDEIIARCFQTYTQERLKEFEQLQSQMRLTNQELTRLVRASKDNLAHLAHELKTPLTSIIGYSDLFLRQMKQNPNVENNVPNLEHIEKVQRNGRQLLRLINDSLEISRYEAGQMQLHPTEINPQTLINQTLEMVESLASAKLLKLTLECQNCPEQVITDSLRLQQILTNLLSNAIRYTETGTIKVICESLPDNQWSITISDTGKGITPEDQKHIFEPYFRVVSADNSYLPNSTGLGLAIVRRLVKLLQGQISLTSQPGIGSTFTITLPTEVSLS
ncbi:sensor histidine kinase [Ancylothrix sp. C2]|uniref:sensor histidine kinase n=1 Tax=Ancylothrix sp. D3o TaxID=2953691 RepID=UPI0021BAF0EC|nr:sensor histidine kinase [Ancylothrix sp. D3o]MCT7952173.1 sensor histidine kinase [Ancylothrix sp. D3o]